MSAADPRPWWASDPDDAPDPDPLTAHREARRGEVGDDDAWWGPAALAVARLAEDLARTAEDAGPTTATGAPDTEPGAEAGPDPADPAAQGPPADDRAADDRAADGEHGPDVCGVCPVCVTLRALQGSRPELVGHLAAAARHLAAAVRSVAPPTGAAPPRRAGDERVQHIDLDG